jgi:hypothetical protein
VARNFQINDLQNLINDQQTTLTNFSVIIIDNTLYNFHKITIAIFLQKGIEMEKINVHLILMENFHSEKWKEEQYTDVR